MDENFRDSSVLISKAGKRVWMYPKKIKGFWMRRRNLFSSFLLIIFLVLPHIQYKGEPFFLFGILERKFILFGVIFWPQDSYLFFLAMISLVIFIILFTVIFGRLWCGWTCPQTILMEMVFRKIEYWIEGDAAKQRQMNHAPMSFKKFRIKLTKHIIFWFVALIIGSTVLSYLVGFDRIYEVFLNPFSKNNNTQFLVVIVFSTVIYLIYSQVRELVCTIICPYGRLQGALVDQHTMVVAYDNYRGETRGAKDAEGDCINCKQCVNVCPTGIDIRNGTQLECINCTSCIDACDSVMKKIKKPKGLIRYASLDQIRKGEKFKLSTRGYAYSAVLVLILSFFIYMFASRSPIESILLRTPGLIYQEQPNGEISNLYNINIVNKSREKYSIKLKVINNNNAKIKIVGDSIILKKHSSINSVFFVYIPKDKIKKENQKLEFGIFKGDVLLEKHSATFIAGKK